MKKILSIFFIFCILLMITYFLFNKKTKENVVVKEEKEEIRAVFISYIDYQDKLKNKTSIEMEEVINNMINNIKNNKFNTIILQVRPFADAIYKSNIYPPSLTVVNKGEELELDILDYFITLSHQNNLKLYAWINPYRLSNTNDKSNILDTASFYDFFNTSKIYEGEDGIYFNPASSEVLNLITNGIKEIVENYSIDGILYDDYFYPNDVIDLQEYDSYKKSHPEVTIEEFRINNINNLIKSTYEAVKSINKNVLFGISPAGNIENNLNNEYLDVKFLLKNKG